MAFVEYHLQFVYKFLLASHQLNQTGDIVGNIESIVPGTSFMETGIGFEVFTLFRVEGRIECSIGQNRTKRTEFFAVIMLIAHRAVIEEFCIFLLSQCFSKLGQVPVSYIIFQSMGYGVVVLFTKRNISFAHIIVIVRTKQVELTRCSSSFTHRFVSCFYIEITKAAHPGIYYIRYGRITFHREGFASV